MVKLNRYFCFVNSSAIILILIVSGIVLISGNEHELGKSGHHVQKHGISQNENHVHNEGKSGNNKANLVNKPRPDNNGATSTINAGTSNLNKLEIPENNNEHEHEDENDGEYDDYSDEFGSQNGLDKWGKDFDKNDLNEISETELDEEKESGIWPFSGPRKIGKCCAQDQSLNSQGMCKKSHVSDKSSRHHDISWFPEQVFDVVKGNWTVPDENDWNVTYQHLVKCPRNESSEVIFDTNRFAIVNDGGLFLSHHQKYLAPLNFCVDLLLGHGRAVRSCFTKTELCSNGSKCLRKCCPGKGIVEEPSGNCIVPHIKDQNNFPADKFNITHGSPSCPHGQYFTEISEFKIGEDGGLQAISNNRSINATFLDYCIDFFTETEALKKMTGNVDDKGNPVKNGPILKATICFDYLDDRNVGKGSGLIIVPRGVGIVIGCAFILSAICIGLAAFTSWRLAELRSLHGKCQLSHLGTLFCLCTLLATVHLGSDHLLPGTFCTIIAVLIHTCALSAFLWLNLLCVNIYLTFRYLRPPLAASRDENRRLLFLCVYAWGIPIAFCLFLFALDGRLEPMPKPGYGEVSCLISNRAAQFAYLYGPVGLLLLMNGILFCLTAKELLCGLWRMDNSDSINFRRKSMGIVVAKMGIVMGLGWILDVLSWGVGSDFPYMFYAADCFNALQGFFIFLVLIWRKRVLEILHLRRASVVKDETLTAARPFLSKRSLNNTVSNNGDADTSLVLIQDS